MFSKSEIAAIRFGLGLGPYASMPQNADDLLADLNGFDLDAAAFPIPLFAAARPTVAEQLDAGRGRNRAQRAGDMEEAARFQAIADELDDALRAQLWQNQRMLLARGTIGAQGFRERLTRFWADHFTVRASSSRYLHLVTPYVEEAIRPNIGGRFVDLLWAVVTHPMMLAYLNQTDSVGPESETGRRMERGLNENLARELLELHTLGVGSGYTQTDVRQMAELLTGLDYDPHKGFLFDARKAEPGAETVLGKTYQAVGDLSVIRSAVEDIAAHPDTASHIARKLAVHFVSDAPDAALVDAMAVRFTETGGDLMQVYAAMLDHPAAWVAELGKVRQPLEFMTAAMRALGVSGQQILNLRERDLRQKFHNPMRDMGQDFERPTGPDGLAEEADAWVTPQGMASRIGWALEVPSFMMASLPDPRDFVQVALGQGATPQVDFAAMAAEDVPQGIALILCSAQFQRR